jgi:flagellar protein FlgJ
MLQADPSTQRPQLKRLRKATQDFEAFFISMVISSMRKAIPQGKYFHSGIAQDVFQKLLDLEIAGQIASRGKGLGIAQMLYEEFARRYKHETTEGTKAKADPKRFEGIRSL